VNQTISKILLHPLINSRQPKRAGLATTLVASLIDGCPVPFDLDQVSRNIECDRPRSQRRYEVRAWRPAA
jgi:hypothetical protein